jgi:hypothetical protein
MKKHSLAILLLIGIFMLFGLSSFLQADRERYRGGEDDRQERHKHRGKKKVMAPANSTHQNICGGCHFPYPPGLLPAAS